MVQLIVLDSWLWTEEVILDYAGDMIDNSHFLNCGTYLYNEVALVYTSIEIPNTGVILRTYSKYANHKTQYVSRYKFHISRI